MRAKGYFFLNVYDHTKTFQKDSISQHWRFTNESNLCVPILRLRLLKMVPEQLSPDSSQLDNFPQTVLSTGRFQILWWRTCLRDNFMSESCLFWDIPGWDLSWRKSSGRELFGRGLSGHNWQLSIIKPWLKGREKYWHLWNACDRKFHKIHHSFKMHLIAKKKKKSLIRPERRPVKKHSFNVFWVQSKVFGRNWLGYALGLRAGASV